MSTDTLAARHSNMSKEKKNGYNIKVEGNWSQ